MLNCRRVYIYICIQLFGYHTPTGYEIVRTNLANEMGPHPVCMYIYICVILHGLKYVPGIFVLYSWDFIVSDGVSWEMLGLEWDM